MKSSNFVMVFEDEDGGCAQLGNVPRLVGSRKKYRLEQKVLTISLA